MSGQRDCSPTTLSATATATDSRECSASNLGGSDTRADPGDECPQRSDVGGGQGPNVVGRSPDGWQHPAKWNTYLDLGKAHQAWPLYKHRRTLAWKVSCGLKVPRSEAFRAMQLVLLRACKRLYEYHTPAPWMKMLVDAIEQKTSVDWDDFRWPISNGYDAEPREGIVSEDMADARMGLCGSYDVPLEIWNDRVPSKVIIQIRNWKPKKLNYPVHPLTELCKPSCKARCTHKQATWTATATPL